MKLLGRENKNIAGQYVCLTGKLASMSRRDAEAHVAEAGGIYQSHIDEQTNVLVIGSAGWPLKRNGHLTANLAEAESRILGGQQIAIVEEDEFLEILGIKNDTQHFGLEQLCRLSNIPQSTVFALMRHNLIVPVKKQGNYFLFKHRDLVLLKSLKKLLKAGLQPAQLRNVLNDLQRWLPGAAELLSKLDSKKEQIILRLNNLSYQSDGQILFDFQESQVDTGAGRSAAEWFSAAVEGEDGGNYREAIACYEKAIAADQRFYEAHFNLGNLLYACNQKAQAAGHFLRVVELNSDYAQAWNNLGNCLVDLKEENEALRAFEKALSIDPDYIDVHYNIAQALIELKRDKEARRHLVRYLAFDHDSKMATVARDLLKKMGPIQS